MNAATLVVAIPVVFYLALLLAWKWIRQQALAKELAFNDLAFLGKPRNGEKIKGTAVICGGSISGLLTARVCHDHFENVLLVDPEGWLFTEDGSLRHAWTQKHKRTRVMQYRSAQGPIQIMGFLALKKLFPNLEQECKTSDIRILPGDSKQTINGKPTGVPYGQYNGDLPKTPHWGRPGVETLLRRLILGQNDYPNIQTVVGTVIGIHADPTDPKRIEKVTIRTQDGTQDVNAVMVCDCTGTPTALKWLRREGYGVSDLYLKGSLPLDQLRTTFDHQMHYSTLRFTIPPSLAERLPVPGGFQNSGILYTCFSDHASDGRVMGLSRVEGDILDVICGTWGKAELPRNQEELLAYAESLNAVFEKPIPKWTMKCIELLAEATNGMTHEAVRTPPAYYERYHLGVNLPSNLVAIGDAVMKVNPIYGQGVFKATLGAVVLNTLLHTLKLKNKSTLPSNFAQKFFEAQALKIESVWNMGKISDYGFETTIPAAGESLSTGKFLRWYGNRLLLLTCVDDQASSAMWHTRQFIAPGIDLFHPKLIVKVLWSVITGL